MKNVLTITTDFKDEFAVAQLHAVMATLDYEGKIIENHSVSQFSIIEGAFQILSLSKFTPPGTVHLGVIDPGVGSKRKGIIIKNHASWYVGPDNGLLYPAAKNAGIDAVWEIDEKVITNKVSNTFHGRDIFIKAAIYISQGKDPKDFGSRKINPEEINKLAIKHGQILSIDSYGNVKILWTKKLKKGKKLKLLINGKAESFPIVNTFADVKEGEKLAYTGSNDTLELAINLGNAAKSFNLRLGEILKEKRQSNTHQKKS